MLLKAPEPFTVIASGRSLSKIQDAIAELSPSASASSSIVPLQLDVTDSASIDEAAAAIKKQFGRIDVLVNNAGICPEGPNLADMFQTTFATNLFGPVLVSAAFRSLLLESSNPYSVYISSRVGSLAMIADPTSPMRGTQLGSVAYRASKAALNMVMLHEQLETKDTNLKTFAMCPGFVVSNIRGTSEEARTGGGYAGSPDVSANLLYTIISGEKDDDRGNFISDLGIIPW